MKNWNITYRGYAAVAFCLFLIIIAVFSVKTSVSAQSMENRATPSRAVTAEESIPLETAEEMEEITTTEVEEEPTVKKASVLKLNLVSTFSQGADSGNSWDSVAGGIYRELVEKDSAWIEEIKNLASASPESIANRIGTSRSQVLGKYRRDANSHDPLTPDTWTIPKFQKVTYICLDGDGTPITALSNAKDILSMASVYSFHQTDNQEDLQRQYALALWAQSHSMKINIGEVYYCDGTLEKESVEDLETEEGTMPEIEPSPQTETDWGTPSDAAVLQSALNTTDQQLEQIEGPERERLEKELAEKQAQIQSESEHETSGVPPVNEVSCSGHIDLQVTVTVIGLNGRKNLYTIDKTGSQAAESGWKGWDEYNRAYVQFLYREDWTDAYGLSPSDIALINPLTSSEIEKFVEVLSADLSQSRREIIAFALGSVGRVPYYWGGKPATADYDGNQFGILIPSDQKGRVRKGLDCSGWINWVYWSVTGDRIPAEDTKSLSSYGRSIPKEDMQPGDIMVRISETSHVVMFLGWEEDGTMRCIHESSTGLGNVTISSIPANGSAFRNLLD